VQTSTDVRTRGAMDVGPPRPRRGERRSPLPLSAVMSMSEQTNEEPKTTEEPKELIMCYISKKMVPVDETVEVSYGVSKKYRVLPKYLKY